MSLTARPLPLPLHRPHSSFKPTSLVLYRSASKGKQTPRKNEWVRSLRVSASLLNCVCSKAKCAYRSHLPLLMTARTQTSTNIINHFWWYRLILRNLFFYSFLTPIVKAFYTVSRMQPELVFDSLSSLQSCNTLINKPDHIQRLVFFCGEVSAAVMSRTRCSVWGHSATIPWEWSSEAPEPRNFSEAPVVYFCSPLWCVSAWLSPAWLCVQEGPVTPDGSSVHASERVWRPGCWPRTTTSDRLKPWALLNQHKAPFQGPSLLCYPPLFPAQSWASHLMEPGVYSQQKWAEVQPTDSYVPSWDKLSRPDRL